MCAAKIPFATTADDTESFTTSYEHRRMRTGEGAGRRAPLCVCVHLLGSQPAVGVGRPMVRRGGSGGGGDDEDRRRPIGTLPPEPPS